MNNKEMNEHLVYHYCSMSAFKSIIENQTIRLSDISKSNDSEEIRWITRFIKPAFSEEYSKVMEIRYFERAISTMNIDIVNLFNELYEVYFDKLLVGQEDRLLYYVCCFSFKEDLLSQWRGYADDGRGVCVGFSRNALEKHCSYLLGSLSIHCGQITYLERYQKSIVKECINTLINALKDNARSERLNKEVAEIAIKNCFQELLLKAVFIKNPFFSEEKEWRVCVWDYDGINEPGELLPAHNDHLERYDVDYLLRDNMLVSYIDLSINPDEIERVVLGPKNKTDKKDVERFLKDNGFNCWVEKSNGTYV